MAKKSKIIVPHAGFCQKRRTLFRSGISKHLEKKAPCFYTPNQVGRAEKSCGAAVGAFWLCGWDSITVRRNLNCDAVRLYPHCDCIVNRG